MLFLSCLLVFRFDPIPPRFTVLPISQPAVGIFHADALLNEFTCCIVPHGYEHESAVFRFQRLKLLRGRRLLQLLPIPRREETPEFLELMFNRRGRILLLLLLLLKILLLS